MEYFIVIGEENHEAFPKRVEDLLVKLRGKSGTRLVILSLGKSIETTIQKLRDALLANVSVPVRLYLARSLDELKILISKILSDLGLERATVFLCLEDNVKGNVISLLDNRVVARVESC